MSTKATIIPKPLEEVGKYLKRSAWFSVIESLLLIMLGVLLVAMPNTSVTVITYIAGIFFVVRGLYQIINYFLSAGYKNFLNNNLLSGIITFILGAALFLAGDKVADIFRIILGIWVIYSSLVHVSTAIKLSYTKIKNWGIILAMALIMLVFGCIIIAYQNSAIVFAGWLLIFGGIFSVISDIFFITRVDDVAKCLKNKN